MRSNHTLPYFLLLSLLFLLAACASPPAADGAPAGLPSPPDPAVQATLGARQALDAAELARLASDTETAKGLAYQATLLWLRPLTLTNEGRKSGLYLAVTMTDPTREAIGEHGMRLRRQMATIGFRMNSPASSRAFLDVSGADGLASGSAGLANGRFVYNISGRVGMAVGFFPDPADLHRFFTSRPVVLHPLPESLATAIANLPAPADTALSPSPFSTTTAHTPYVFPRIVPTPPSARWNGMGRRYGRIWPDSNRLMPPAAC